MALDNSNSALNTCPICQDDVDEETGLIRMPMCQHVMHVACYAQYMSYHVNQKCKNNRQIRDEEDIRCPFCRQLILAVEKKQPVAILRDLPEFQHENRNKLCGMVACTFFMFWLMMYLHNMISVLQNEG